MTTYLTVNQVAERFGVSRPTIWRWLSERDLPDPIRLSRGCTRWKLADLEAWEAEQAKRPGANSRCA